MAAAVTVRRTQFAFVVIAFFLFAAASAQALDPPTFNTVKIADKVGGGYPWTEPRIAVGPDGKYWAVTNTEDDNATAYAFSSADKGNTFKKAEAPLAGQTVPSPDVDIIVLPTGRIIASELDDAGVNSPTSYSGNNGKPWTSSVGATQPADQDRECFACGPKNKN